MRSDSPVETSPAAPPGTHPGSPTARLGPLALALAVLASVAPSARAQSGALDPTFGTSGIVTTAVGPGADLGQAVGIQADDKIVVAGTSTTTAESFSVVRYDLAGGLDTTFGGTGRVIASIRGDTDRAFALAVQDDQAIVVAGSSRLAGNDDFAVARFRPDGSLDPEFDGDGKVTTAIGGLDDQAFAVAIQPDGRIVAAGTTKTAANRDLAIVRYLPNGALDPSFSGDGKVTLGIGTGNDEAFAVAIDGANRIVVAGYAADGSQHDMLVARFESDGDPDPTFAGTGALRIAFATGDEFGGALAIQPDGMILVAGHARIGNVFQFAVARVDQNGVLDPGFDGDGKLTTAVGTTSEARAIALAPSGRFVVAGLSRSNSNDDFALARYGANGSLDGFFASGGIAITPIGTASDQARGVAIQTDRKIVVAGSARLGGNDDFALARFLINDCGNGVLDPGEQCDGGAVIGGDCCAPGCNLVAAGTECRGIADACDLPESCDGASGACPVDLKLPDGDGDGVCDDFDLCPVDPDPAQADGDADGQGDACDACTNGVDIQKPRVKIAKYTTGPGDDSFALSGTLEFAVPPVLDPIARGARLIVEDGLGDAIFDVAIPHGAYSPVARSGWVANGAGTAFTFRARTPVDGVLGKLKLSRTAANPGVVKVTASGNRGAYAAAPVSLPLHLVVVLDPPTAASGECGEATFSGPTPACSLNAAGSTLVCK